MSNVYWTDRYIRELQALLQKSTNQTEAEIIKLYKSAMRKIKSQMVDLYQEIQEATKDGTLLVSDLYRYNRYYQLINSINTILTKLGSQEINILDLKLILMYRQASLQVGNTFGLLGEVNQTAMNHAVYDIWCDDGKSWSDRVWNHKLDLQASLEQGLVDTVAMGQSRSYLIKLILQDFNTGYFNAARLVRTEMIHVYTLSAKDRYEVAGITKYQFIDTEDDRTCEGCDELDGNIYLLKDLQYGKNAPPIHSQCRCCIIPVIDGRND